MFIEKYKQVRNASEAARLAGYSPKTAGNQAHHLLKDKEVASILGKWEKEEAERLVPRTKEEFARQTFERSHKVNHEPTKAKYWEIGGKVQGFLSDDSSRNEAPILNIICNEMSIRLTDGIEKYLAPQPQSIVDSSPIRLTDNLAEGTNLTDRTLCDIGTSDFRVDDKGKVAEAAPGETKSA